MDSQALTALTFLHFENRLIYSSNEGFLTYDEISNTFSKYATLNKELGSFAKSNKIIKADEKNIGLLTMVKWH
jgi:hypothetical protein